MEDTAEQIPIAHHTFPRKLFCIFLALALICEVSHETVTRLSSSNPSECDVYLNKFSFNRVITSLYDTVFQMVIAFQSAPQIRINRDQLNEKTLKQSEVRFETKADRLGSEHLDTLLAMHEYARNLLKFNKIDKALEVIETLNSKSKLVFGELNYNTIKTTETLIKVYLKLDRKDEVTEIANELQTSLLQSLENPTAEIYNIIEAYESIIQWCTENFGHNNDKTLKIEFELMKMNYMKNKDSSETLLILEALTKKQVDSFGGSMLQNDVYESLYLKAIICMTMKMPNEAIATLEKLYPLSLKLYGENHSKTQRVERYKNQIIKQIQN